MSFSLVLNSGNLIGTNNNTFQYQFKRGNFNIPQGSQILVSGVQIPYSFYNITAAYGNNQIIFNFPTGTTTYATYNIIIPDGFYTQSSFNNFLQQWMIRSGAGRRGPLWLPLQARKWRVIHSNTAPLGLPPGREPGPGTN